jgi:hypothetical protein
MMIATVEELLAMIGEVLFPYALPGYWGRQELRVLIGQKDG